MALVPADIVDQISRSMYGGRAYTTLNDDESNQIDAAAARGLIPIEQFADNIQRAGSSDNAPAEWATWYFWQSIREIAPFVHPDRKYREELDAAKRDAITSYQNEEIDYDLSADSEYATVNFLNIRKYVLDHWIRLDGFPAFPAIKAIDAAAYEVYNSLWNRSGWTVRRRLVRMKIDHFSFTDATWTAATRTITKASGMSAAAAGSMVLIVDGTSAVTREFTVISATDDALVVASDIGADDAAADIEGRVMTISFENLPNGESYDSTASVRWYYSDRTGTDTQLRWSPADRFAEVKAAELLPSTGRPRFYRTSEIGTTDSWIMSPFPDKDYFLTGEIYIATPTDPTSATDTDPFTALFKESLPWVKRATLDQVLTNHGKQDAAIHRGVVAELELMFPAYQDLGLPNRDQGVEDVNDDTLFLKGGSEGFIGGPM